MRVDDLIVGNAVPEAEQGLQIGRMISVRALGIEVPGMTVNRYCASGLETIAIATAKIHTGQAECIVAGGTESMSLVPTVGWKTVPAYSVTSTTPDYYLSMSLDRRGRSEGVQREPGGAGRVFLSVSSAGYQRYPERVFQTTHIAHQCRRSISQ